MTVEITERMNPGQYNYSRERHLLEEYYAQGLGLGAAFAALDRQVRDIPSFLEKIRFLRPRTYHEVDIVNVPQMGRWTEVPLDAAIALRRMLICGYLQQFITPDVDAVVELGCGAGDIIVSLARDNTRLPTRFIGTEIAVDALACVKILADIAGVKNVDTAALDLCAPALTFLKPSGKVLFYTCGVFAALNKNGLANFLRAMAHYVPSARLCAFEPIAAHLIDMFPTHKPIFKTEGMNLIGHGQWVWPEIKDAVAEGLIKLERVLPDVIGAIAPNTLSLIQIVPAG